MFKPCLTCAHSRISLPSIPVVNKVHAASKQLNIHVKGNH